MKTIEHIIAGLILILQDRPSYVLTKEEVKSMIISDIDKIVEEVIEEVKECK